MILLIFWLCFSYFEEWSQNWNNKLLRNRNVFIWNIIRTKPEMSHKESLSFLQCHFCWQDHFDYCCFILNWQMMHFNGTNYQTCHQIKVYIDIWLLLLIKNYLILHHVHMKIIKSSVKILKQFEDCQNWLVWFERIYWHFNV